MHISKIICTFVERTDAKGSGNNILLKICFLDYFTLYLLHENLYIKNKIMKNKEFYDKQNEILGKMVDILVENKYFITNYNGYKRWAGTHPLSYKEWLMCWENKTIQDAALRYGYKGELLDKSLIRE